MNVLATIRNENNEKYLILRKKYYDEAPGEDTNLSFSNSASTSMMSIPSEFNDSPMRNAPPAYRAPPKIIAQYPSSSLPSSPMHQIPYQPPPPSQHPDPNSVGLPISQQPNPNSVGLPQTTKEQQYKECVTEFQHVMSNFKDTSNKVDVASRKNSFEQIIEEQAPSLPPRVKKIDHRSISRETSVEMQVEKDENKENKTTTPENEENKFSVKEAMLKFNRFASEEEAKIPSPISKLVKNRQEKVSLNKCYFLCHVLLTIFTSGSLKLVNFWFKIRFKPSERVLLHYQL